MSKATLAFKAMVWHRVPWTRLAAIVVLALLGIVATSLSALMLSVLTAAVVVALAATDRLPHPDVVPNGGNVLPPAAAR